MADVVSPSGEVKGKKRDVDINTWYSVVTDMKTPFLAHYNQVPISVILRPCYLKIGP
jgi:hypothetical protein